MKGYKTYQFLNYTDTRDECVKLVVQTKPNANAATYSVGSKYCYAGFGVTGTTGSTSYQTCIFDQGNASCTMVLCCLQIR